MDKIKLNIQLFANKSATNNATTPSDVSSSGFKITMTVEETGTNVTNNTSALSFTAKIESVSGAGYSITGGGKLEIYLYDNKSGSSSLVKSATYDSVMSGTPRTLTATKNVTHKDDGTLSIYVYAKWTQLKTSQYIPHDKTVRAPSSGSLALTTIARADTITSTDANIGSNPTITLSHNSSSFRHNVTATFSGKDVNGTTQTYTYDILLKASDTGNITQITNWQLPTALYDICLESKSITGTLTCQTYNGNTLIGTKTVSIKALIPDSCKPTVTAPTYSDTDTVSSGTIGVLVVGKSVLQYNLANTFTAFHNSPLDRYELYINGSLVYSGTNTTYLRDSAIQNTSNTYELRAYDKRGNFGTSGVQNLTAYAYNPPSATINVDRDSTTTTTANVTYSGSITNINNNNHNSKSFKIYHKESTSSTWPSTPDLTITNNYNPFGTLQVTGLNNDKKYDFKIVADDSYPGVYEYSATLTETFTLINFAADGKGLAFGKISEEASTFEVALASKFLALVNFINTVSCSGVLNISQLSNLKINNSPILTEIINAIYPTGSVLVTNTNSNPGTYLGGTWVLIDKEFTPKKFSATDTDKWYTPNSTNTDSATCYATRAGHTITIEMTLVTKVALTDSNFDLIQFDIQKLGIASNGDLGNANISALVSDVNNGIVMAIWYNGGNVRSFDVIQRGSSTANLPAGANPRGSATWTVTYDSMDDSACNKFFWKRTA